MEGEPRPRGQSLGFLFVSLLIIQGIQAEIHNPLECYKCVDQGDHGCSMEKATKVMCREQENVCMEAMFSVQTRHETYTLAMRDCGAGELGKLNKTLLFHGTTLFIQAQNCNTSLCNAEVDLEKYRLSPSDNSSRNSTLQCYSCIGKASGQCLPSNAPALDCFDKESHCFDGNATITIKNNTLNLPIKSCSTSPVCAKLTETWSGATLTMLGSCCSENKCNKDLSKQIQYGDPPHLILFPNKPLTTPGHYDNTTSLNTTKEVPSNNSTALVSRSVSESTTVKAIGEQITSQVTKQTLSTSNTSRFVGCIWTIILLSALTL